MAYYDKLPSRGEKASWKPKFSMMVDSRMDKEELTFARQLGYEAVYMLVTDEQSNAGSLREIVAKAEAEGLEVYRVTNRRLIKNELLQLGLEGRDAHTEKYKRFIEALGEAGITCTDVSWQATGIWDAMYETGKTTSRGCEAREVDETKYKDFPLLYGRSYEREEIWDNFKIFLDTVIPVCEAAGVALALHPNDPPIDIQAGAPTLIRSSDDYRRVFSISDSRYNGMTVCTGCWLERKDSFGDLESDMREFVRAGKVYDVHFRNVEGQLPYFKETFLDNGSTDMYPIMRVLCETGYKGAIVLDHTPVLIGDPKKRAATAYAVAYMRALATWAAASFRPEGCHA